MSLRGRAGHGSTDAGGGDALVEAPGQIRVMVPFQLEELWFLQHLVRQHDKQGQVWDRADMRRIHRGIARLGALPAEQQQTAAYELECDESLLWLIEQQVPMTLMQGSAFIGRAILTRVFQALQTIEMGGHPLIPELEDLLVQLEGGDPDGSTG
jgi:hypothetical protein